VFPGRKPYAVKKGALAVDFNARKATMIDDGKRGKSRSHKSPHQNIGAGTAKNQRGDLTNLRPSKPLETKQNGEKRRERTAPTSRKVSMK